MVHDRVHVPEIALETMLVADPCRSGSSLDEIDRSRRSGYGIGSRKLQLHLAWHIDQVTLDGLVPDFLECLVKIGSRRAECGFGFTDRRLNGDATPDWRRQIGSRLSPPRAPVG